MSAIKNNFTHLKTNHRNISNLVITISLALFSLFDLEWKVITKDMDTKKNKAVVTNAAYLQKKKKRCIFFTYAIIRSVFIFIFFVGTFIFSPFGSFQFIINFIFFQLGIGIPEYYTHCYIHLEEESGLKLLQPTCPRIWNAFGSQQNSTYKFIGLYWVLALA